MSPCKSYGVESLLSTHLCLSPRIFRDRVVGDPAVEDVRRRLVESSPVTHFSRIQDPVLFVQGVNDPRALPQLTLRYVETLRRMGKHVELLAFEDEGHDVIKLKNKAVCYQRVVDFFKEHLEP
jgi:dipeptidyl aminopeptidase/acylaminoacyl peptidase